MTFEQWWAENADTFMHLAQAAGPLGADTVKKFQASCWNAALDAASEYKLPASAEEIVTHIYEVRA